MMNEYEMTMDDELTSEMLAELENERLEIELDEKAGRWLARLDGWDEE